MKTFILSILAVALLAFSHTAQAQSSLTVDIQKASFNWLWNQSSGGSVSEFRIKCGPTSGNYTAVHTIVNPAARSEPVLNVVNTPGKYFCVITAANQFGESGRSNEVEFDAGDIPVAPTGFAVGTP